MTRRRSLAPLLALAVAALALPVAAQDASPTPCSAPSAPVATPAVPGGDDALSAEQPGPAPGAAPIVCWTGASGNAALGGRALVIGDQVLTLTDQGEAVAFGPDGSEAWRVAIVEAGQGLLGGLTTDGTSVYVGTPTGLVALSPTDGSTQWTGAIDPGPMLVAAGVFSPVVAGANVAALVYTTDEAFAITRSLVAWDRATGAEAWSQQVAADLPAGTLTADESSIAVVEGDGSLVLRDVASGEEQLRITGPDLGAAATTPVALTAETLLVGLGDGSVTSRARLDGSERWRAPIASGSVVAVTASETGVFVNGVTTLVALDAAAGTQAWEASVQEAPPMFQYQPIPALADGLVIMGTTDMNATGALLAFDQATGAPAWRVDLELYGAIFSPVVAGGRVYAPSFDIIGSGGLLAFGTAD